MIKNKARTKGSRFASPTPWTELITMPSSTPAITTIEPIIYKALSSFKGQESIKISEFLRLIPLNRSLTFKSFPRQAMIRSIILMKLKGIKFEAELARYLRKNEQDSRNLGFFNEDNELKTPNRRTLNRFINLMLTAEEQELIDFIVNKTLEVVEKFELDFDIEVPELKVKDTEVKESLESRIDKKLDKLCRFAKENIYPYVGFPVKHNAIYSKELYLDILTYIALSRDFTQNGCRTYRKNNRKKRCPSATDLLYHITKVKSIDTIQKTFEKAFDFVYKLALKSGVVDKRNAVDVAIDYTVWYYYGSKNDQMVLGTEPKNGTCWGYKFVSLSIVEYGKRLTLMVLPVGEFTDEQKLLEDLIGYARQKIKIKKLYIDRHFFAIDTINLFKKLELTFLMPAIKNARIKKLVKIIPAPTVIKKYIMGEKGRYAEFNLVVVERDVKSKKDGKVRRKKFVYATNIDINENDMEFINKIPELYRKRWGIETSYRMKKGFRAQTTSKNYKVRLMYFMYSALLYNLWIVIDSILGLDINGRLITYHLVTSKMFGTILYTLGMGS